MHRIETAQGQYVEPWFEHGPLLAPGESLRFDPKAPTNQVL